MRTFGVYSPDSTRAIDPDRYLELSRDGGRVDLEREPDSKALLIDLRTRSVATLEFCGTLCAFDGAFWIDSLRFALTGAVVVNDSTNASCGRVRLYDLNAGTVTEYRLPTLADPVALARFRVALDSAQIAHYRAR